MGLYREEDRYWERFVKLYTFCGKCSTDTTEKRVTEPTIAAAPETNSVLGRKELVGILRTLGTHQTVFQHVFVGSSVLFLLFDICKIVFAINYKSIVLEFFCCLSAPQANFFDLLCSP